MLLEAKEARLYSQFAGENHPLCSRHYDSVERDPAQVSKIAAERFMEEASRKQSAISFLRLASSGKAREAFEGSSARTFGTITRIFAGIEILL
jgi:hypothetical protein